MPHNRYELSWRDRQCADGNALMLGFAGVYSSFLLHTESAARQHGVDSRDILVELGRRKMIGGQEDMIYDTAMSMAKERGLLKEEVLSA